MFLLLRKIGIKHSLRSLKRNLEHFADSKLKFELQIGVENKQNQILKPLQYSGLGYEKNNETNILVLSSL